MTPILRDYQERTIANVQSRIAAGVKRILIVAPCGAGKTVIAAEFIRRSGVRVLFLAAQKELVEQTSAKLDAVGVEHGIIMAGIPGRYANVQVASVQTLVRRDRLPRADIIIIDEADLAAADSYGKIIAQYEKPIVIGMTGTPWRTDGRGLSALFDDVVVAATPKELIAAGHLVDFTGTRFEPLDTAGIATRGGDYAQDELGKRATATDQGRRLVGNVVAEYLARTPGKRAACFAVNVEHSKMLAAEFVAAGVAAEHIDGTMHKDVRAAIFDRVRSGRTLVLCNWGIVTRGVDVPALEVAILARPTKSLSLYLQKTGRVMRTSPGKTHAIIHDHAGCTALHGFFDDERDYSLTLDKPRRTGERVPMAANARCPSCFVVVPGVLDVCPHCSASLKEERQPTPLKHVEGVAIDFGEIRAIAAAAQASPVLVAELKELWWDADQAFRRDVREKKPSARQRVANAFNRKHGHFPTSLQIDAGRRAAGFFTPEERSLAMGSVAA